jgi:hypothetical protein
MPTSLPKSVRASWSEEVADDFSRWTIRTIALFGGIVTVLRAIAEFGG